MPDLVPTCTPVRITSVIASLTAGGIGPVCRYAAEGMARATNWQVTLLSLHDPPAHSNCTETGLRTVCLGLDGNCARPFLRWLHQNPQDLLLTSDVSRIEPAFPFLPAETRHIIQIHDSAKRYRSVAVRHAACIEGVTCVGRHIERPLRESLKSVGFRGLLSTIHNGAAFPPLKTRPLHNGPLRLLFMGRTEALKGVFDLVPLLQGLKQSGVPVTLNIAGGENAPLRREFARQGLSGIVTWSGRIPHEQCYDLAASSDLLLMLSRKEPFGMVTIEAMSMGCVPVAYDIPSGSREIIEHLKTGLLVPLGNIPALVRHILRLHKERSLLFELSSRAVERARGVFSAERMSNDLVTFCRKVMDHSKLFPAVRKIGLPPETAQVHEPARRGYQRLPAGLREWIRTVVGRRPKLCYWWLNR